MSDHTGPGAPGKFTSFMANGGGTVTVRMVLMGSMGIIMALVTFVGNGITSDLKDIKTLLQAHSTAIVANQTNITAIQGGQARLWSTVRGDEQTYDRQIEDGETRITRLESCQPRCAPR